MLQFIKKEEPMDFCLCETNEEEITGSIYDHISNDFGETDTIPIKKEPDEVLSIKEEDVSESKSFVNIPNETLEDIIPIKQVLDQVLPMEEEVSESKQFSNNPNGTSLEYNRIAESAIRKSQMADIRNKKYKCYKCRYACRTNTLLKYHSVKHEQSDIDQCKICLSFFPISMVQFHTDSHSGPPYTCKICLKTFSSRRSWYKHRSFHDNEVFQCDMCGKQLRSKKGVLDHLMTFHLSGERKKNFECKICGVSYFRSNTLNRHVKQAHESLTYRCSNTSCDRVFVEKSALESHRCRNIDRTNIKPRSKSKRYTCDKCKRYFTTLNRYVLHTAQNCNDVLKFECDYCAKLFPGRDRLTEHFRNHHKIAELNIACHLCNRLFSKNEKLQRHLKRCSSFQTKEDRLTNTFKCKKCGKGFHTLNRAVLHAAQNCSNKIWYECDYCSKSFPDKTLLLYHFGSYHKFSDLLHHSCSMCNKSFQTRWILRRHLKSHDKDKINQPSECKYCSRIFIRSSAHKLHLKRCILRKSSEKYARYLTEPTDQRNRNFICEICNCTFLHKSYIVEHMKIVHSENSISKRTDGKCAYRCLICKKSFAHKRSLRNHTNRMHNDDQKCFICNCCNKKFISEKKYLLHIKGKRCTKKIQCSICARTFKWFSYLEKHFHRCGKEHRL